MCANAYPVFAVAKAFVRTLSWVVLLFLCSAFASSARSHHGRGSLLAFSGAHHLSSSTEQNRQSQNHHDNDALRKVCIICNLEESKHYNAEQQHAHLSYATSIATSLSLDLLTCSEGNNNSIMDMNAESSALSSQQQQPFSHILRVLPYERGSIQSSILTVEALPNITTNKNKKSSQRRSQATTKKRQGNSSSNVSGKGSCFVDLCPPRNSRMGKRVHGELGKDLMLKAVTPKRKFGLKNNSKESSSDDGGASIVDLTAGFAQDSLTMALGGANRVHMVERDPIVAALLQDGMRRLRLLSVSSEPEAHIAADLCRILSLHHGDGTHILPDMIASGTMSRPDIVYLDPMFPPRTKSAAVKKNMHILHGLLGTQDQSPPPHGTNGQIDSEGPAAKNQEADLLAAALEAAQHKVVVKRPLRASVIGNDSSTTPSYSIDGSTNRFDVYVVN